MEAHPCKLCSRSFANGRALGGHMKSHLAPRPAAPHIPPTLSSTTSPDDAQAPAIYVLRENPRKNVKFSDPEFSFSDTVAATLVVVQDGESEAESRDQSRRVRRKRRSGRGIVSGINDVGSPDAEAVSSVSDTSPEEDVAMCLMMLSRDDGRRNPEKKRVVEDGVADSAGQKKQQQHQCEICNKWFRSSQALGGHRIIHRKKVVENKQNSFRGNCNLTRAPKRNRDYKEESDRIFDCPFCGKVFGSGQALGGHKRSHLMGGFGRSSCLGAGGVEKITTVGNSCIDLNKPAPTEDEDVYSVVSDDEGGGQAGDGPINY